VEKTRRILDVLQRENNLDLLAELYVGLSPELDLVVGPWEIRFDGGVVEFVRRRLIGDRLIARVRLGAKWSVEVFEDIQLRPLLKLDEMFVLVNNAILAKKYILLGSPTPSLTPWTEDGSNLGRWTMPLDPREEPVLYGWVGQPDVDGRSDWRLKRFAGDMVKSKELYMPFESAKAYVDQALREEGWALL